MDKLDGPAAPCHTVFPPFLFTRGLEDPGRVVGPDLGGIGKGRRHDSVPFALALEDGHRQARR